MSFKVVVSIDALLDIQEIDDYISRNDSPAKADAVIHRIERAISSLSNSPHRGSHPPEELEFGISKHREIFFKPYRIVYWVRGGEVVVELIADGRRNMRTLLQQRLLVQ